MKLLILLPLFLIACAPTPANRDATSKNAPTPAPERTPDEFISRDIDRMSKLAGMVPLKTANLAQTDTEIRVWYGFGLFALEGFVVKRTNNQWSAFHLKADHYSALATKRVARVQLAAPKSGWESCWQRLVSAGVLILPSGTEGPDPDAEGFYVEIMDGGSYRNYQYNDPEYSESPNAKRMLTIGDIISAEFGLSRFHVTKPAQSSAMPNKSLDASGGRVLNLLRQLYYYPNLSPFRGFHQKEETYVPRVSPTLLPFHLGHSLS